MIEENVEKLRHRWSRRHPWITSAMSLIGTVCGLGFAVNGGLALLDGNRPVGRVLLYLGFWGLVTLISAFGLVRQVRIARDPTADDARLQAIIDQPRDQLVRKAHWAVWGFAAAFVAAGLALALTGLAVSGHMGQFGGGCLLVVLGVVILLLGEKRLRDPAIYD